MKSLIIFGVFLLFVNLSQQLPHLVNCTGDSTTARSIMDTCGVFTCDGPNNISGKGCGTWRCAPGKHIGYKESDNTKPYPECCGGPICAD